MAEVPAIELVGLSETQKRALRLADNKIALNAGWDLDLLKVELAELATLDVDLDLAVTGFSTGELDVLLSGSQDPDDDAIPPVRATPRTDRATSGSSASIGSAAGTAGTSSSCRELSAKAPDRRGVPRPSLQCPDQRSCQHEGSSSGVRDGLGRDDRGGLPQLPERHAGRRRPGLPGRGGPLHLHGLAPHG